MEMISEATLQPNHYFYYIFMNPLFQDMRLCVPFVGSIKV